MAVTKSRRIAGWTMIVALVITIAITLLFFLGGSETSTVEGYKAYNFTDIFLYWAYALVGITLVVTIVFALIGLVRAFRMNAKKALQGFIGFILLVALLVVTYVIGNGDPHSVKMLSDDSNKFLTPGWLKTTDMMLYSCYALLVVNILALVWGAIKGALSHSNKAEASK